MLITNLSNFILTFCCINKSIIILFNNIIQVNGCLEVNNCSFALQVEYRHKDHPDPLRGDIFHSDLPGQSTAGDHASREEIALIEKS